MQHGNVSRICPIKTRTHSNNKGAGVLRLMRGAQTPACRNSPPWSEPGRWGWTWAGAPDSGERETSRDPGNYYQPENQRSTEDSKTRTITLAIPFISGVKNKNTPKQKPELVHTRAEKKRCSREKQSRPRREGCGLEGRTLLHVRRRREGLCAGLTRSYPARGGRTQRPRGRRCPRPASPVRALSSYAANMAERSGAPELQCARRGWGRAGGGRACPPSPPADHLRRRGLQAATSPPACPLLLARRAAPHSPAAGERSGSGRSPNRSMAEADRRRRTRSPRAAAAAAACTLGDGNSGCWAVAVRALSVTRGRARNATNWRATWLGRPRILRAGEKGWRGGGAERTRTGLQDRGPEAEAAMFPGESWPLLLSCSPGIRPKKACPDRNV
ncbi:serine/arginine repetitive matrix protein 3-like [Pipistrellus kuhlii]|uniref:serine/arginine repetitive matrix protein 3-like n=1 Tax=Pipistrellus kuhlii TaxID=59472 RepID=UPI001E26F36C|nr:serine/arginine repetitive matrix protein 3-like [Pipistrellus kuhlii]